MKSNFDYVYYCVPRIAKILQEIDKRPIWCLIDMESWYIVQGKVTGDDCDGVIRVEYLYNFRVTNIFDMLRLHIIIEISQFR